MRDHQEGMDQAGELGADVSPDLALVVTGKTFLPSATTRRRP
jgi:hypothetical protein